MVKSGGELPIISLFSGALGLDLGLEQAGRFRVRVAVESNPIAVQTLKSNRPGLEVIPRPIEDVTTQEILAAADLGPGDAFVVTGGPSCQAFSTAGQRGSMSDTRGRLFSHFLRVVREAQPRYFVMENVRGVLSAAVRHRKLAERGPGHPSLAEDEEMGSALAEILRELRETNYYTMFDLVNAADFGVPQTRERVLFIGTRVPKRLRMPTPTHARGGAHGRQPWRSLRQALEGLADPSPAFTQIPPGKRKYMERVPEGGNWRDLPEDEWAAALGGAFDSWGGRTGFYRRLAWNEPTPALTTRPDSKATMLCHPSELRPLSVREYARVQQFPDTWKFAGSTPQQYVQVGNAVPLGLGKAVGETLLDVQRSHANELRRGKVVCASRDLLDRLRARSRTVLNPKRMRVNKDTGDASKWVRGERDGSRAHILEGVTAGDPATGQS